MRFGDEAFSNRKTPSRHEPAVGRLDAVLFDVETLAAGSPALMPGVRRLATELRRRGVATAAFSARDDARARLQRADAVPLFDVIAGGVGAIRSVLQAASRAGSNAERWAVVHSDPSGIEVALQDGCALVIGVGPRLDGEALRRAGAALVVTQLGELTVTPEGTLAVKTVHTLPRLREHQDEIRARLSGRRIATFLDYDGTLTPIVEDYTKAWLPEAMRATLARLCTRVEVAVVSGRDAESVRNLVGLRSIYYAGSHGFEIIDPEGRTVLEQGAELLPEIDHAEARLRELLADIPGHAVDRKRFSTAVHYRLARAEDVPRIEAIVDHVLAEHGRMRKGFGKKVFRLQPDIQWDKGHAVLWILDRLRAGGQDALPIYVGDDATDEDAFRALGERGLTCIVTDVEDRVTGAEYSLADPEDVRRFLEFVADTA